MVAIKSLKELHAHQEALAASRPTPSIPHDVEEFRRLWNTDLKALMSGELDQSFKMKSLGIGGYNVVRDLLHNYDNLRPKDKERVPVYLAYLKAKIAHLREGKPITEFVRRRVVNKPAPAAAPVTNGLSAHALARALLGKLMVTFREAVARAYLNETDLTDDEKLTAELVRAIMAQYPDLNETDQ